MVKEGDGNTKFFHWVAYGRSRKNLIFSINIGDVIVDYQEATAGEICTFFPNLYACDGRGRPVIENLNYLLLSLDNAL